MMRLKLRELKCLRALKCKCQDSNPGCLVSKLALLTPKSVSRQKMHAAYKEGCQGRDCVCLCILGVCVSLAVYESVYRTGN